MFSKLISFFSPLNQAKLAVIYFKFQFLRRRFNSSESDFYNLSNYILEGDTVVDIGSNVGRYSLEFSRLVGNNGFVFSFEMAPRANYILNRLLHELSIPNVCLINVALGDESDYISYSEDWIDPNCDFLFHTNTATTVSKDLNHNSKRLMYKGDVFLSGFDIDFIKIDVEGFEVNVLNGLRGTISRCKPYILVENNSEDIFSILYGFGYKLLSQSDRNLLFACHD